MGIQIINTGIININQMEKINLNNNIKIIIDQLQDIINKKIDMMPNDNNGMMMNQMMIGDPMKGNPMMENPMMGNPMMGNPMMGNPMMGMNLMNNEDDDWLKGFKQGIEEINKTSKKFI